MSKEKWGNEELYPKQTMWLRWINVIVTSISSIFAIIISIVSYTVVKEVQEVIKQQQIQYQEQITNLENMIEQEQFVDVIQARDNILIKTDNDKWIVIPMLVIEDITIPDKIIEYRHSSMELSEEDFQKKGLFDIDTSKIQTNDTFTYKVPTITINPNILMSLRRFIKNIYIEFNIYTNDGIQKHATDRITIKFDELQYDNVFSDLELPYQYVTDNAWDVLNGGNGINKIKISVVIEYQISDKDTFVIPYSQENFTAIDEG
mgnify:CR=1 FL=1